MNSVLKDLQESLSIMQQHGTPSNYAHEWHVPLHYARVLQAELLLKGVDVPYPYQGDEMSLEFTCQSRVTLHVH